MNGNTIRLATRGDLLQIREWLEQEHNEGVHGSFFCNYGIIENGQKSGSLTVLIRESDQLPIVFCLGTHTIDIFATKNDCRRQGYGRQLAEWFIEDARRRDLMGLYCECSPVTSKGFWKERLEFESVECPYGGSNDNWVALSLPHDNEVPDGPRCTISVAIEDSDFQMQPAHDCDAVRLGDRCSLVRDYVKYVPDSDRQLEIRCDGETIFHRKNKYVTEIGGERKFPWVRIRELIVG